MALYSDKVMDHFRNPRNVGVIEDADGVGEVGNPVCGDIMRIYLKIADQIITDVKFETFGCGSAIASSSMATELIKGKPLSEALALTNRAVVQALDGLPAHKMHCSVLAEEAIKKAIQDYYDKSGIAYDSRAVGAGSLFVCLKGFEADGHRYICVTADAASTWQSIDDHAALYRTYCSQEAPETAEAQAPVLPVGDTVPA